MNSIIEELKWRGFYAESMGDVENIMKSGETFYLGCDPSSVKEENRNVNYPNVTTSLHIGHLSAFVCAMHMQKMGMHPILLVGDYTAKFGDGAFKTCERPILSFEEIDNNTKLINIQLHKLFGEDNVTYVRNGEWMDNVSLVDFMRKVGSQITVNYLMSKDAVKSRFENGNEGISLLSFVYPTLQAWDFIALKERYNCRLELAGNDQQGNVSTTFLLNHKLGNKEDLAAWFLPLVTDENGKKFGKSEGRAIYLDARLTSPFEFYQFWLNQSDVMAEQLIKKFTFLSRDEIESLIAEHKETPHLRKLQKVLAFEVTKMVHSEEDANKAIEMSNALFDKNTTIDTFKNMDEKTLLSVFNGVPQFTVKKGFVETNPTFIDFAVESKFGQSKGSVRKEIMNGGLSLNKVKVGSIDVHVGIDDLIHDKYLILQRGKKYALATVD